MNPSAVSRMPVFGRVAGVAGLLFLGFCAAALPALLAPSSATAHSYKLGAISIGHVWAPPPKPGAEGLPVYGPILNGGAEPIRLVAVSTPIAEGAGFRIEKDGEATTVDSVEFQPGRPLALAPWRQHIWLTGLKKPVDEGDSFELTLDFGEAGKQTVTVMVQNAAGH